MAQPDSLRTIQHREQNWKTWDKKAQKEGSRLTVYGADGSSYTGEWSENKRHGKKLSGWALMFRKG